jgi:sporulation protein YlmC with PRC-barrel domain
VYGEKMVEVTSLFDLDIYTIAGQYVGRVVDVVLNIRMGTISKLQVKALEPENKNVGIRDIFRNGLQFVPEENEMRAFQEGVLNVDFDKVRAIGDIMLIDPQDIERQAPSPSQVPPQGQDQGQAPVPNQGSQNPV